MNLQSSQARSLYPGQRRLQPQRPLKYRRRRGLITASPVTRRDLPLVRHGFRLPPGRRVLRRLRARCVPPCLLPVNLATGASGKATPIDASAPAAGDTQVALSRDGKTAYVVSGSGVVPVNVAAGTKGTTIPVGNASSLIAISSDGRFLYVTTDRNRDLVRVSLASGRPDAPISVGATIGAIAAGPDGMVYAYDNAGISAINATAARIASTLKATWHEDDTYGPSAMAITPDGTTGYVNATDGVIPLSLRTMQAGKLIDIAQASGAGADAVTVSAIVASPDDKGVYVGTEDGSVYPVSVASNHVGKPWDMTKSYIYSMAVTR